MVGNAPTGKVDVLGMDLLNHTMKLVDDDELIAKLVWMVAYECDSTTGDITFNPVTHVIKEPDADKDLLINTNIDSQKIDQHTVHLNFRARAVWAEIPITKRTAGAASGAIGGGASGAVLGTTVFGVGAIPSAIVGGIAGGIAGLVMVDKEIRTLDFNVKYSIHCKCVDKTESIVLDIRNKQVMMNTRKSFSTDGFQQIEMNNDQKSEKYKFELLSKTTLL